MRSVRGSGASVNKKNLFAPAITRIFSFALWSESCLPVAMTWSNTTATGSNDTQRRLWVIVSQTALNDLT